MRYSGNAPVKQGSTSLGAHVRALAVLLMERILDEQETGLPSPRVPRLRGHLRALVRAYPQYLAVNESDLAQSLAELDGEEIQDSP